MLLNAVATPDSRWPVLHDQDETSEFSMSKPLSGLEPDLKEDRRNDVGDRTFGGCVSHPTRAMLALPSNLSSPALARALVAEALRDCPSDTVDVAVLLVSEIVTNAVVHAEGSLLVLAIETASALVVSVEDTSPEPPAHDEAALDGEHGRGLGLVDALASRWGWHPSPPGKVVWFELALS